ncbi:hypothetical protein PQ610_00590 [Tardisphaera miroshnichenkoae]
MSSRDIARQYGVSHVAVLKVVRSSGAPSGRERGMSDQELLAQNPKGKPAMEAIVGQATYFLEIIYEIGFFAFFLLAPLLGKAGVTDPEQPNDPERVAETYKRRLLDLVQVSQKADALEEMRHRHEEDMAKLSSCEAELDKAVDYLYGEVQFVEGYLQVELPKMLSSAQGNPALMPLLQQYLALHEERKQYAYAMYITRDLRVQK